MWPTASNVQLKSTSSESQSEFELPSLKPQTSHLHQVKPNDISGHISAC